MSRKLSAKQQKFVEAYDGNSTKAALAAGYSKKTARNIGCENLTKPYILEAIEKRGFKDKEKRIATREERQKFWTDVMYDEEEDMKNRLKAAELLGKSDADFIHKVEISGKPTVVIKDLTGKKQDTQ